MTQTAIIFKSATKDSQKSGSDVGIGYWLLISILAVAAWAVGEKEYYTPGSDLGYNLGLVGGIMMLLLLLYPLSKRMRFLRWLVPLKYWFMTHMFLGVLGPLLILFHSTLKFQSINGAVAFLSMSAVALSGLVGRFIYTRIHHGLYGKRSSLEELKQQLGLNSDEFHSKFQFAPEIEGRLHRFEEKILRKPATSITGLIGLLTLSLRAHWHYLAASRQLKKAVRNFGKHNGWTHKQIRQRVRYGKTMVYSYLKALLSVAHFTLYERLFSWWHVLHVPLMFLLVLSGVIHVLAVHMY